MTVLLVSPVFHGYWRAIVSGFRALGHSTTCVLYDERSNSVEKAVKKLTVDLPARVGSERVRSERRVATDRVARAIAGRSPSLVLVVRGDVVDPMIWTDLEARGIPVIGWFYDELRRMRYADDELRAFRSVATYSPLDYRALMNKGFNAHLVPMAYDVSITPSGASPSETVVFVGSRYSAREVLLSELARRGVPVKAYGRDWSRRLMDRARTLSWSRPRVPGAPGVSRIEAGSLMERALASLNISGDQDGFGPRVFEACGVGAFQLIDRADVDQFYEPGTELVVFDGVDAAVSAIDRARRDVSWARGIRQAARARTLAEHTYTRRCAALLALC